MECTPWATWLSASLLAGVLLHNLFACFYPNAWHIPYHRELEFTSILTVLTLQYWTLTTKGTTSGIASGLSF